jgi:glycosyltransferase involved in cell wall biosynthesis
MISRREKLPEVTVILPAYFEEKTISEIVVNLDLALSKIYNHYEIIVVIDGIVDNTKSLLLKLNVPNLNLLIFQENQGKGAAIAAGIRNSKATEVIAYIDSDLDIHLSSLIFGLLEIGKSKDVKMLVGSKVHPNSIVHYPTWRRFLSIIFSRFVRIMLDLDVRDTQTGLKVASAKELRECLPLYAPNGWTLDIAILQNMKSKNYNVLEIPVRIDYRYDSRLSIKNSIDAILEVIKIRKSTLKEKCEKL